MYPTVCTLMGLWRFVIAKGVTWRESTTETSALLDRITIDSLNIQRIWRALCTIVQIAPDDDILPVRANYGGEPQAKIGSELFEERNSRSGTPWRTVLHQSSRPENVRK